MLDYIISVIDHDVVCKRQRYDDLGLSLKELVERDAKLRSSLSYVGLTNDANSDLRHLLPASSGSDNVADHEFEAAIMGLKSIRPDDVPILLHILPPDIRQNLINAGRYAQQHPEWSPRFLSQFDDIRNDAIEFLQRSKRDSHTQREMALHAQAEEERKRKQSELRAECDRNSSERKRIEAGILAEGNCIDALYCARAHANLALMEAALAGRATGVDSEFRCHFNTESIVLLQAVIRDLAQIRPSVQNDDKRLTGLCGEVAAWYWGLSRGCDVVPHFIRYRCVKRNVSLGELPTLSPRGLGNDCGADLSIDGLPVEVRTRHANTDPGVFRLLDDETLAAKLEHSRRVLWFKYRMGMDNIIVQAIGWNKLILHRKPHDEPLNEMTDW